MHNGNNREKEKHDEERHIALLLLHELRYEPNESMSGECPDLVIPSREKGIIGVEITKYLSPKDYKDYSCFQKLLDEYVVLFEKKKMSSTLYDNNTPYTLCVHLHGGTIPHVKNCSDKKKQIFKELDECLFPKSGETYNREYIATVDPLDTPNIPTSKVLLSFVEPFGRINNKILYDRIKEKEKRLEYYKSLPQNKGLKEYYLLIFIPEIYQINLWGYKLPCTIDSGYNRIYLTSGRELIRIDL